MARELGYLDVDGMLSAMKPSQFIEWVGFFIAEKQMSARKPKFDSSGDVETDLRAVFGRPSNGG